MATTIRDLLVKLGVDAGDADKQVEKLDSALSDLKGVMQAVVGVGAALTGAFVAITVGATNAADAVAKGAERTGLGVEAYQELAHAASQSGVEVEQLEQALVRQNQALLQVEEGAGGAADAYAALGLTQADLVGLTTDEAFIRTAGALASVADETERLQLTSAIYGLEFGTRLLPMLNAGSEGLEDMAQQARDLGLVMSGEDVDAAVLFSDALDQAWSVVKALRNTIGLALLPTLNDWVARLRDWYTANRQVIDSGLSEWVDVLVAGLQSLERAFTAVDAIVQDVLGGWTPIFAAVAAAVAFVGAALTALVALKAWAAIQTIIGVVGTVGAAVFAKIVLGIIAATAAVVGLYLAIDDLIVFFQGGDSALGRFLDRFREADGILGALARTIETIMPVVGKLGSLVMTLGEIWWAVFQRTTLPAIQLVGAALLWLAETGLGALGWYWDNIVQPMWEAFGAALDWILGKLEALQPALQLVLGGLDSALGAVSDLTGVDVSVGGGGGTTAAATSTDAGLASALFAPTGSEATGGASLAAAATSTSTTDVQVQGNTYTITGTGWTEDDILDLISKAEDERARATAAALGGGEV